MPCQDRWFGRLKGGLGDTGRRGVELRELDDVDYVVGSTGQGRGWAGVCCVRQGRCVLSLRGCCAGSWSGRGGRNLANVEQSMACRWMISSWTGSVSPQPWCCPTDLCWARGAWDQGEPPEAGVVAFPRQLSSETAFGGEGRTWLTCKDRYVPRKVLRLAREEAVPVSHRG